MLEPVVWQPAVAIVSGHPFSVASCIDPCESCRHVKNYRAVLHKHACRHVKKECEWIPFTSKHVCTHDKNDRAVLHKHQVDVMSRSKERIVHEQHFISTHVDMSRRRALYGDKRSLLRISLPFPASVYVDMSRMTEQPCMQKHACRHVKKEIIVRRQESADFKKLFRPRSQGLVWHIGTSSKWGTLPHSSRACKSAVVSLRNVVGSRCTVWFPCKLSSHAVALSHHGRERMPQCPEDVPCGCCMS